MDPETMKEVPKGWKNDWRDYVERKCCYERLF